jgi:DNA-3-methyladenine glycosylase
MQKIPLSFYQRSDVVKIATELLGKLLITNFDHQQTIGRIVETEAYNGIIDKASHAYNGRRTARTEVMYAGAGTAYVYLCYGIHHLFNVVTNKAGIPHAVLIRALEPVAGTDTMLLRTGKPKQDATLTRGPGNAAKAMGIQTSHTGISLLADEICIAQDDYKLPKQQIISSPRIGVDYAGEDALLPYRFYIKGNQYVSGNRQGR